MPDGAVKCPTGPSNSRLYGGNVKSNALGLPGGGGGLIAVGFPMDFFIPPWISLKHLIFAIFWKIS